jgi:hypothetical protein
LTALRVFTAVMVRDAGMVDSRLIGGGNSMSRSKRGDRRLKQDGGHGKGACPAGSAHRASSLPGGTDGGKKAGRLAYMAYSRDVLAGV